MITTLKPLKEGLLEWLKRIKDEIFGMDLPSDPTIYRTVNLPQPAQSVQSVDTTLTIKVPVTLRFHTAAKEAIKMTGSPADVNIRKLAGMFSLNGQPINQGDVKVAGQKGDGLEILAKAKVLFPGVALTLAPPPFWPYLYVSTDGGVTDFWLLSGIYVDGGGLQYQIAEFTGNLADRALQPNPFVDGAGGPTLKFRVVEPPSDPYPGNVELYWGK